MSGVAARAAFCTVFAWCVLVEIAEIAHSPAGGSLSVICKYTLSATTYAFTKGDGANWQKGSTSGLDFTVKGSPDDTNTFDFFTAAQVDGDALNAGDFDTAKGSLELTLKADYLETLDAGSHTLKAQFKDGSAEAKFTVKAAGPTKKPTDPPGPTKKPTDPPVGPSLDVKFSFKVVWEDGSYKSVHFNVYKPDGSLYKAGLTLGKKWQYTKYVS